MPGRRTNIGLLAALAAATATGALAFSLGTGWNRWATVTHAIAAFSVLALAPWKSAIVRRGLRRHGPSSVPSFFLGVAVAISLASGVAHATGTARSFGFATAIQVHVGSALLAIAFGAWHVIARPQRVRRADLSRRALLRAVAVAGIGAVAAATLEAINAIARLPGRDRRFTGSYRRDASAMPVTQWLDDRVPSIDREQWTLHVDDRVLRYDDIAEATDHVRATLDCTGGWYAEADWAGVSLSRLMPSAKSARSIVVESATGYRRRFPAADAGRLLLATRLEGRPLDAGHGFPARIVAPGRRGFWWVKWVVSIRTDSRPWWLQLPFPPT